MTFNPSTNQVSSQASLLSYPYEGKLLVVNRDLNNTVYIGGDQGVSSTNPNTYGTIDPLGTITFENPQQLFAVCAPGQTATVEIIPDGESFSVSPATIATQISEAGIALIDNPQPILNPAPVLNLAPGAHQVFGPFLITQFQSWFVGISPSNNPATPYVGVRLFWTSDAAGQFVTEQQDYVIRIAAASSPSFSYYGHGPMYGKYLSIEFINYDSVNTSSMVFQFFGSNRVVPETTLRSVTSLGTIQGQGSDDILYFENNTSLAAGGTSILKFANLFTGQAQLRIRITGASGLGVVNFMMNDEPASDEGNFNSLIVSLPTGSATTPQPDYLQTLFLPKRHTSWQVNNGGTTSISYRIWLTAKGPTV